MFVRTFKDNDIIGIANSSAGLVSDRIHMPDGYG